VPLRKQQQLRPLRDNPHGANQNGKIPVNV